MRTVCEFSQCAGCMACIHSCPTNAIVFEDDIDVSNCIIDKNRCVNCGKCHKVCPNNTGVVKCYPQIIKQGWAEDKIRMFSSSGGVASAIMESFVKSGGYVCSCLFERGAFIFKTTNDLSVIRRFAGSKYVKSDPTGVYGDITDLLKENKKILFVGLPCQSAGIQNYFHHHPNIYTVDLICHGTPSFKLLSQYLSENGVLMDEVFDIKFRTKDVFGLYLEGEKILPARVKDSYLSAFLECVDYTENCYLCRYATLDRVSDVTLGDAWGQLSETTPQGVSLILCQTDKGRHLIESANLNLHDVNVAKAIAANHQLQRPAIKSPKRSHFIKAIKKGHSFRFAAFCAMPKESIKQCVKYALIRMRLLSDNSGGGYRLVIIKKKTMLF